MHMCTSTRTTRLDTYYITVVKTRGGGVLPERLENGLASPLSRIPKCRGGGECHARR